VLAQAGRPWVDPPSDGEAKTQATTTVPTPPPTSPQVGAHHGAPAPTQQASTPRPPQDEEKNVETQSASEAVPRKAAATEQGKQKVATERKVRGSSQQASMPTRSQSTERRVVRRREPTPEMSEAQPRNGIERRARITRYGSMQEGLDAGLQVMRLRTIQLPDGRRIQVLTRPDQDLASGLSDGY